MSTGAPFLADAAEHGDQVLPARALDEGIDTFVISAPVAGYTTLFDPRRLDHLTGPSTASVVQHTLTTDRLRHAGQAPLANPSEMVAGHFRFGDPTPQVAVGEVVRRLELLTGLSATQFQVRTTERLGLAAAAAAAGVPAAQVHVQPDAKRLSLGAGKPHGEYLFVYAHHRRGIVPVASVGVIGYPRGFATDASVFIERTAMIRTSARWPSEWEGMRRGAAIATHGTIDDVCGETVADRHRWLYLTRAATLCLLDGLEPSHAFSGHTAKKVIRMLATQAVLADPDARATGATRVAEVTQVSARAAIEDWFSVGYAPQPGRAVNASHVADGLVHHTVAALRQLRSGLSAVLRDLGAGTATDAFAQRAHGSYGVTAELLAAQLDRLERPHELTGPQEKPILGYVGYPFDHHALEVEPAQLISEISGTTPLDVLHPPRPADDAVAEVAEVAAHAGRTTP